MAINYTTLDPSRINTYSIGFDRMFDSLTSASGYTQQTNYPPYNIIKKSDTEFLIEVAIAGFSKDDVEVRMAENRLNISSIDLKNSEMDDKFIRSEFEFIANKLGLSVHELQEIFDGKNKSFHDYKNKYKIFNLGGRLLNILGLERRQYR